MEIRELQKSDYSQYCRLYEQLAGVDISCLNLETFWKRYLELKSVNNTIYVLTVNKEIVSTCRLCENITFLSIISHIEDVVTNNFHRGKGYGKRLIEYAVSKASGYKVILQCKSELKEFYEKCGFHSEGFAMVKRR